LWKKQIPSLSQGFKAPPLANENNEFYLLAPHCKSVSGSTCYDTGNGLYKLNSSGQVIWSAYIDIAGKMKSLALGNDDVVIGGIGKVVFATTSTPSAATVWTHVLPQGEITGQFLMASNGVLYVTTTQNEIIALKTGATAPNPVWSQYGGGPHRRYSPTP